MTFFLHVGGWDCSAIIELIIIILKHTVTCLVMINLIITFLSVHGYSSFSMDFDIFDILFFRDFDALLYLCIDAFGFLQFDTFERLTNGVVFPLYVVTHLGMLIILFVAVLQNWR